MSSDRSRRLRGSPVLVATLFAAALLALAVAPARAQAPADPPSWLTYDRPADYEPVVAGGIQVPTRDGSYLSCDHYQPGRDGEVLAGPFPGVLFQYHAYGNNRTATDPPKATFLAERGYVVLQCNVRGTGGSPGQVDIASPQEARDGYDMVEWLAAQPNSTGGIAVVGFSYGAITTNLIAGLRPPHLVTIVPHASWEDPYRDIFYLGGARTADVRGFVLGLLIAQNATGTPPEQQAALVARAQELDAAYAAHPLYDDFWRERGVDHAAIAASGIPILVYGGWYDIYQRGGPANYEQLRDQTWLVMEPAAHLDSEYFGDTDRGVLAWLDHWLLELPDAPLPSARVTSYEMPAETGGGWTELAGWPPPDSAPRRLHLRTDGALTVEPGEAGQRSFTVDQSDGMPSYWNVGHRPDTDDLRAHHTAREAQRLAMTSEVLTEDVVLAGTPRATIPATFSADDGYLVVRVSDVDADGVATLLSTGWLKASHRTGHLRLDPPPPGEEALYEVELWPSHWRFAAGHRIQVSISSGDVPRLHPDAPSGTVTIATGQGGATVDLPLRGAPVSRLAGPTRTQTSVALARHAWPTARRAILASAAGYADALTAATLAGRLNAPVLLTYPDALDREVGDRLERLGVGEVVVLGGEAALPDAVIAGLDARGLAHRRIAGADRYATAAALADEVAAVSGRRDRVVLVAGQGRPGGDGWPDALTAGRLAAFDGVPLLLTRPDEVPPATLEALRRLLDPGGEVVVVGGEAAVGPAVQQALVARGWRVRRIAGADRYATAAAVAQEVRGLGGDGVPVLLASGRRFPDALAAAAGADQLGGPLLLVDPDDLEASAATAAALTEATPAVEAVTIVGGSAAVSDRVAAQLADLVGGS